MAPEPGCRRSIAPSAVVPMNRPVERRECVLTTPVPSVDAGAPAVTLSEAKGLARTGKMLRCAQPDNEYCVLGESLHSALVQLKLRTSHALKLPFPPREGAGG